MIKVYGPPLQNYFIGTSILLIGLFILPLSLIGVLNSAEQLSVGWFLLMVIGFAIADFMLYLSVRFLSTRLVISPQGFVYFGLGVKADASWSDVVLIRTADPANATLDALALPYHRVKVAFVLSILRRIYPLMFLAQLLMSANVISAAMTIEGREKEDDLEDMFTNVPVGKFDKHWRDTKIGEYLRQDAPHLFASEQEKFDRMVSNWGQWRKESVKAQENDDRMSNHFADLQALAVGHTGPLLWLRVAVRTILGAQVMVLVLLPLIYSQLRSILL